VLSVILIQYISHRTLECVQFSVA